MDPTERAPDGGEIETPVCMRCFNPVSPYAHVCGYCGHSAGQFTPYLPFESIRFYGECLGTVWERVWYGRGKSAAHRVFCAALIAVSVPWLFLASPLVLWHRVKKRRAGAAE
ncbi:MAG: hypothetical protein IPJ41_08000 [Phycisphaerales bacterium]|nr:hypothetical protein [Phycisphaerales bacterium]